MWADDGKTVVIHLYFEAIMQKKSFPLLLVALVCVMLAACSKGAGDDLKVLLKSVPADAVQVGVVDLESLGDKLIDNKQPNDNLKKILAATIGDDSSEALESIEDLYNGKAGVKSGCLVYFEGSHSYITGLIEDAKTFRAYVEKFSNAPFTTEGDFTVSGNIAFNDKQFWAQTTGSIDSNELVSLTRLTETQSFLSTKYAEKMLELDDDVVMLMSFQRAMQMSGGGGMEMNILSSALFDDARYVAVSLDVTSEKNKPLGAEIEGEVLNSKFKPAKFLLPTATISVEDIKKLDGRGGMIFAMAINPKMVDKIAKMASSFGGSLPKNMLDMLKCLDGTMALSSDMTNSRGFIHTKKGESEKLAKYLTELFPSGRSLAAIGGNSEQITFTPEGNEVKIAQGILPTGVEVTKVAHEFKGAMVGLLSDSFSVSENSLIPFDGTVIFLLKPNEGSLKTEIKMIGSEKKANATPAANKPAKATTPAKK